MYTQCVHFMRTSFSVVEIFPATLGHCFEVIQVTNARHTASYRFHLDNSEHPHKGDAV